MIRWIIGSVLTIGTIAATIYASLYKDTKDAKASYEEAKNKYLSEISKLQKEIEKSKKEAAKILNPFDLLYPVYVKCENLTDKAEEIKNNLEYLKKATKNRIEETTYKMDELYYKSKTNINISEKEEIFKELAELEKLKLMMSEDMENMSKEHNNFMNKVLSFTLETRSLKIYIRDNCDEHGKLWYEKSTI